ncbi:hypothetical protein [Prosthecomicrobium hirschii]|uniref:hypothetical protein n=1 Tax=Prosthecodimorpha hirschii TaxID=665126 RepID=UPI00221FB612|nr:hypothetical protein [Prosthecomicrobium hirschii]MCW1843493.1 hypothetical protein [Prosthecomicrobium hirschii]
MTAAAPDIKALGPAIRFADAILRPIGRMDVDALAIAPLPGSDIRALSSHPAFAAPINRAVRERLRLTSNPVSRATVDRLMTQPKSRLALLFATERAIEVDRASMILAATVLHKRIAGMLLKSDRIAAQKALGSDAFAVAVHEAPFMHASLAELDRLPAESDILTTPPDAGQGRIDAVNRFGLHVALNYVEAVEPEILPFVLARLHADAAPAGRRDAVAALQPGHVDHIVKLMRRRLPSWSAIIG